MNESNPDSAPLIAVEDALNHILQHITAVDVETVSLAAAFGRVLAEPVVSTVDVPPFANSAMDGYAIIAADSYGATPNQPATLKVVDNIPAGGSPTKTIVPGTAARIMTGAPMPPGADAVIRFEETSEYVSLPSGTPANDEVSLVNGIGAGDNVRLVGEDIKNGQTILRPGQRLRPQDIGILAAVGQARLGVYRRPRVAVLATGDELVALDQPVTPGKIRNSNGFVQTAMIEKYGGQAINLGIARDTISDLTHKIQQGLAQDVDLFLTSAGVSIGDYDMVKSVLAAEGEMQFWQVNIKPGKPLAFGTLHHSPARPGKVKEVPLLGLPGNPVAAMVAFEVFARPAILKLAGHTAWDKTTLTATLDEDITNSGRRHYMRASVYPSGQGYRVTTRSSHVHVQGSGILTSMVWANALVVVPEAETHLSAGSQVNVWILD